MHIGGVVDQVAQPDNILLLQDLGLNAAVRKISAEQLELLKQIALNAIAYYLRANDMETSEVVEELSRAERKLAEMQPGVESLRRAVVELSGSVLAGLGR